MFAIDRVNPLYFNEPDQIHAIKWYAEQFHLIAI